MTPAFGENLGDLEHHPAVRLTTQIAEHVVERDATAKHHPRRDGGIESPGEQRHCLPLYPEREPTGPVRFRREEERVVPSDLHEDFEFRVAEIDGGAFVEGRAELNGDIHRTEPVSSAPSRPHGESTTAYLIRVQRRSQLNNFVHARPARAVEHREAADSEDSPQWVERPARLQADEQTTPALAQFTGLSGRRE